LSSNILEVRLILKELRNFPGLASALSCEKERIPECISKNKKGIDFILKFRGKKYSLIIQTFFG
jgi:hypothetical protein